MLPIYKFFPSSTGAECLPNLRKPQASSFRMLYHRDHKEESAFILGAHKISIINYISLAQVPTTDSLLGT